MTCTAIVLAVTVAGLGVVLVDSRSKSRDQLVRAFNQREAIGAALFESLLNSEINSSTVPKNMYGPRVTNAIIRKDREFGMQSLAVFDAKGELLAGAAFTAAAAVPSEADNAQVVRNAVSSHAAISNVVGSPPNTSLEIGTAFLTRYGVRVEVDEFPLKEISSILPSYMSTMNEKGGVSFIADASNRVIGTSVDTVTAGSMAPDPDLELALRNHPSGPFTKNGADWHFTSGLLPGTDWKIVLAAPDSVLFSALAGPGQYVSWVLMTMLLGCGLIVMMFVRRARRDAESLAIAYAKLELRNAEVEEANEAKTRFLAGMSHELRTPLNGIIGFAELMHDGKVGAISDQHREYLGDILTSARHLLTLINDVLDMSKVEAGKIEFNRQAVPLARLVNEVQSSLRTLAEEKRIRVTSDIDPRLGIVWIDPSRFKQVLLNYVSNSIKFTNPGGQVWIRLSPASSQMMRLEVEDNGVGISPGDLEALFSEFGQVHRGVGIAASGTGLGLSLTKRLVEAQGGAVSVRSKPGVGSVFGATLPCAEPSPEPGEPPAGVACDFTAPEPVVSATEAE